MKINFSLTSDEYEMFIKLYNIENLSRLTNGKRIISMSKFFILLIEFYNIFENNKGDEIKEGDKK